MSSAGRSSRLRSRTMGNARAEEMKPGGWARVVARRREGAITWRTAATCESFERALHLACEHAMTPADLGGGR